MSNFLKENFVTYKIYFSILPRSIYYYPIWAYQNSHRRQAASITLFFHKCPGVPVKIRFIVPCLPSPWMRVPCLGGWSGGHARRTSWAPQRTCRDNPGKPSREAPTLAGPRLPGHHRGGVDASPLGSVGPTCPPQSRRRVSARVLTGDEERKGPTGGLAAHGRRNPAAPCRRPSSRNDRIRSGVPPGPRLVAMPGWGLRTVPAPFGPPLPLAAILAAAKPDPVPRPRRQVPWILARWLGLSCFPGRFPANAGTPLYDCPGCVPYVGQAASQGPFAWSPRWIPVRRGWDRRVAAVPGRRRRSIFPPPSLRSLGNTDSWAQARTVRPIIFTSYLLLLSLNHIAFYLYLVYTE
jgi:hypothetical protein